MSVTSSLISPASVQVSWTAVSSATSYRVAIALSSGGTATSKTVTGSTSTYLYNLTASTAYTVNVYYTISPAAEVVSPNATGTFTTAAAGTVAYGNLYTALEFTDTDGNASHDTTVLSASVATSFRDYLVEIMETGDYIYGVFSMRGRRVTLSGVAVKPSEALTLTTSMPGIYLPFTLTGGSSQYVDLTYNSVTTRVTFTTAGGNITISGITYSVGDVFTLFDTFKGTFTQSLILLETLVRQTFGHSQTKASSVATGGTTVFKEVVSHSHNHVAPEDLGNTVVTNSSFYVTGTSDTTEVSRITQTLDKTGDNGEISMNVLKTYSNGVQTVEKSLTATADQITLRACNETEETGTILTVDGLSFDNDSAGVFFGSNKDFRIKYSTAIDGTPLLLFQALGTDDVTYTTKFQIERT